MNGKTPHETALAAVNGDQRAHLIAGMTAYLKWCEDNPGAPIPLAPVMNVRVPDFPDEDEREAYVRWFAGRHGVPVQVTEDGCHKAIHQFGAVTVEAHYTPAAAKAQNAQRILHGEAA